MRVHAAELHVIFSLGRGRHSRLSRSGSTAAAKPPILATRPPQPSSLYLDYYLILSTASYYYLLPSTIAQQYLLLSPAIAYYCYLWPCVPTRLPWALGRGPWGG